MSNNRSLSCVANAERPVAVARSPRLSLFSSLQLVALAALGGPLAAQAPLWVSTSNDQPAAGGLAAIDDAALYKVGSPGGPEAQFSEGHWLATLGKVPGDVDALARLPGAAPGSQQELVFSLLSNEFGHLDGDLLVLGQGGFEELISEATLAALLGAPGANIDVDALAFDELNRTLLSLQNDLVSSSLGTILDGDVLRLEADGSATRLLSEAQVQAKFTEATGLNSAIGDVLALEWVQGVAWVVVQSPSSYDGAVLGCGSFGQVLFDEASLGLGGGELDALVLAAPDTPAVLSLEPWSSSPGQVLTARLSSGDLGHPQLVLCAGAAGYQPGWPGSGFGAWYLDPLDPWLNAAIAVGDLSVVVLDAAGAFSSALTLPQGVWGGAGFAGDSGWSFQALDLSTLELGAPFRVRLQ